MSNIKPSCHRVCITKVIKRTIKQNNEYIAKINYLKNNVKQNIDMIDEMLIIDPSLLSLFLQRNREIIQINKIIVELFNVNNTLNNLTKLS